MLLWSPPSKPNSSRQGKEFWLIVLENEPGVFEMPSSEEVGEYVLVIGQRPDQSRGEFAAQVISRMGERARAGRGIDRTMIRIAPCASDESMNARERVARAFIADSARMAGSELVFVVKSGVTGELETRMLDMIQSLSDTAHGPVNVRVSFGDRAHRAARPRAATSASRRTSAPAG